MQSITNNLQKRLSYALILFGATVASMIALTQLTHAGAPMPQNPQSGSTGLQGQISSPPPTTAATITTPGNGQSFSEIPIRVRGICPGDLLVKLFKNNVFGGSVQCKNGSYEITTDLFSGRNELVVRVYDALDQAGPDSNVVVVNFNDSAPVQQSRVALTSNFAKRGANPGQVLTWPIVLSGGEGPYAISVDWGDGKTPDLISRQFPGNFDISHTYENPGVYNIIIKATDKNGNVAYLQLVGVGNGQLSQTGGTGAGNTTTTPTNTNTKTTILWQPAAILLPMILFTFWLGKKHELKVLRTKIEQGERPF